MKKGKQKGSAIALSVLTIVCSISLLAGATFALFTDRQDNDVTLSSGEVQFVGNLELVDVWGESNDAAQAVEKGTVAEDKLSGVYPGEGTVTIAPVTGEEAFSVTMNNVAQGETASFALRITNTGSVKMKYLVYLEAKTADDLALLNTLEVSVGGQASALSGSRKTVQDWTQLSSQEGANTAVVENIEITLPWGVDAVNGSLNFGIEAVQYNASTSVEVNGVEMNTLEKAFESIAQNEEQDSFEVVVGAGTQFLPEIDLGNKNVTLVGANGKENTVINGDYNVSGGSITLQDVSLNGNVSGKGDVTLTNVTLNGCVNVATVTALNSSGSTSEVTLENVDMEVSTVNNVSAITVQGSALNMSDVNIHFSSELGEYTVPTVKLFNVPSGRIENCSIDAKTTNTGEGNADITGIYISNGTVDVVNCTIAVESTYNNSDGYGDFYSTALTAADGSVVNCENCTMTGSTGVFAFGNSSVKVSNAEISCIYYALTGNNTYEGADFELIDSYVETTAVDGVTIYKPMGGDLVITNSTVKGGTAIESKFGKLVITDSTIESTQEYVEDFVANRGGSGGNGSAILLNAGLKDYVKNYPDQDNSVEFVGDVKLITLDAETPKIALYDWGEVEQPFTFTNVNKEDIQVFATDGVSLRRLLESGNYVSVKLNNDVTYTDVNLVSSTTSGVLDLNGKTLTATYDNTTFFTDGAQFTVKNGNYNAETVGATLITVVFDVYSGSKFTMDGVKFTTVNNSALGVNDKGTVLTVNDSVVTASCYCVATNAKNNGQHSGVEIILTDSSFISTNNLKDNCPICLNVEGNLTMTNCIVKGERQGILIRGGTAVITGGKIETSAEYTKGLYLDGNWKDGNEVPMAALVIGNRSSGAYDYPASVTLSGVEVVSAAEDVSAIYMYGNTETNSASLNCEDTLVSSVTVGGGTVYINGELKTV